MDQKQRVAELLKGLEGQDAAKHIRGMQSDLARLVQDGRRRAEVDGPIRETDTMTVDVLAFENKDGSWKIESIKDAFPGCDGQFAVTDINERVAVVEFRWRLAQEMVRCSFCRPDTARKLALKANIAVQGRVPYVRITGAVR